MELKNQTFNLAWAVISIYFLPIFFLVKVSQNHWIFYIYISTLLTYLFHNLWLFNRYLFHLPLQYVSHSPLNKLLIDEEIYDSVTHQQLITWLKVTFLFYFVSLWTTKAGLSLLSSLLRLHVSHGIYVKLFFWKCVAAFINLTLLNLNIYMCLHVLGISYHQLFVPPCAFQSETRLHPYKIFFRQSRIILMIYILYTMQ